MYNNITIVERQKCGTITLHEKKYSNRVKFNSNFQSLKNDSSSVEILSRSKRNQMEQENERRCVNETYTPRQLTDRPITEKERRGEKKGEVESEEEEAENAISSPSPRNAN